MHDDIGSGLTSILIHAQLLEHHPLLSSEQKKNATKISETGAEISQRLNTFIWTLNEANDSLQGFLEYVKNYASKTFEGTGVDFQYHQELFNDLETPLSGQLRKNLFYCVKELITNTLKHAKATKAVLNITVPENKQLQITFEDNGIGIEKENKLGNGLLNIEKRIKLHKGQFHFLSEKGCKATLKVAL
ncbi:MAG: ATP-binding protein [Flavobacteriaceae bacterium]